MDLFNTFPDTIPPSSRLYQTQHSKAFHRNWCAKGIAIALLAMSSANASTTSLASPPTFEAPRAVNTQPQAPYLPAVTSRWPDSRIDIPANDALEVITSGVEYFHKFLTKKRATDLYLDKIAGSISSITPFNNLSPALGINAIDDLITEENIYNNIDIIIHSIIPVYAIDSSARPKPIDSSSDEDINQDETTEVAVNTPPQHAEVVPNDVIHPVVISPNTSFTGSLDIMSPINLNNNLWTMDDESIIKSLSLSNNSKIVMLPSSKLGGYIFYMNEYLSDNSQNEIHFHTQIGNNEYPGGYLWINGDSAGTTFVTIHNHRVNGSINKHAQDIELIEISGDVKGNFIQRGRVVYGAYDYRLLRDGPTGKTWYLTNKVSLDPSSANSTARVYRPEAAGYISNQIAANKLFISNIHDRFNQTEYVDPLSGQRMTTHMWMKTSAGIHHFKDSSGQLASKSTYSSIQLGDILNQWSTNDNDVGYFGITGGYGKANANSESNITGYRARSNTHGYNLGLYTTWFADRYTKLGAYIDIQGQYSWFKNSVETQGEANESYKSKGFTTSVETGFKHQLIGLEQFGLFIQPKAQAAWLGIKTKNHVDAYGTLISPKDKHHWMTNVGLRSYMLINSGALSEKRTLSVKPYLETNWIHNSKAAGIIMDNAKIDRSGGKHIAEVKLGIESLFNKNLNIWGNLGHQMGKQGYSDTNAGLGVKYLF
ncbi:autotransporter outer membrane beta-barrel domain-containing protein [Yersinia nurmii]|uniref:Autotransporter outer membrane beta-barrel domain-containing protein n=1 Tax=Yersinia nurmii TaxID=685706 RepID=A0AAW7JUK9_9GAMM|nr:autotransporter outer membrane beta-barrel domain-containing protein [Yersinia nurmii]MDN0086314.1 autotransporter outer membrane beta-barrel domain-containing protein [Yersinia nurmii]